MAGAASAILGLVGSAASLIGGGSKKPPAPQAAPPVPQVDEASLAANTAEARRLRRGRAANILVNDETAVSTAGPSAGAKTTTGY